MRTKPPIFLSASVPTRNTKRYPPEPLAIREAVRAAVAVAVTERCLVFGGHPAITPLVWDAANSLDAAEMVFIYQSELYRLLIPPQVRFFKNVVWTPIRRGATYTNSQDVTDSLAIMRDWMITKRQLQNPQQVLPEFHASVFIGGMEGVEEEFSLFVKSYPAKPTYPVASTEGAARILWQNWQPPSQAHANLKSELASELNYRSLLRPLLG